MATQRYISTSFWDDAWIQELDPSEKLLYLYLMTNPLTNIAGVYKITVRRIVFDTGFNEETVRRILGRFEADKKACLHGEYIIIPSWPKHQKCETRQKIKDGIQAVIDSLPEEVVEYMVYIGYAYHIEGYPYHRNYSDSDSDIDINTDSDSSEESTPPHTSLPENITNKKEASRWKKAISKRGACTYPAQFEELWTTYPRKDGKKAACKAWLTTLETGADIELLLECVRNYAVAMRGTEAQFVKLGSTFFGPDEPWRDYEKKACNVDDDVIECTTERLLKHE